MLFCGVLDPIEQVSALKYTHLSHCSAVSDTPQDLVLLSDTQQDLVLRGLIPRRILFCRVSDPTGKFRPRRIRQKSFESLPFSLKGHFLKIVCMYKLHYTRLTVSMLKEPPILKMFFFVLPGMIPRETTVEFEYLGEFELEFNTGPI
jgi:hypothetical protein